MGSTPVGDSENSFSEYFHLRALLRLQQGLFGKVHVGHDKLCRVRTLFQKQISRTFPGLGLIFQGLQYSY